MNNRMAWHKKTICEDYADDMDIHPSNKCPNCRLKLIKYYKEEIRVLLE